MPTIKTSNEGEPADRPPPLPEQSAQPAHLRLYLLQTAVPLLLVGVLAVYLALHFVRPAPPNTLTIAAGPAGSRFDRAALQYQKILARNGITLKIVATEGSIDNLRRLRDARAHVDIGFVQTGTIGTGEAGHIVSLGSMFYEPLYIFYRGTRRVELLSAFQGRRIEIGPEGSGTRALALALLDANGIRPGGQTALLDLDGEPAKNALLHHQADAIFLAGDSASAATIREVLHEPDVQLYDFPQADAYLRRFHYLSELTLPAGSFDLGDNIPATPIKLVAPTVELLAHDDLHPALSDLLIEAATEVHGHASLLQSAGQFPTPLLHDFPISADAARFYKSGRSLMYRFMPFWLASLISRTLVAVVPILLLLIPALRYLPALYNWRYRRRINQRYGQLMALERESLRVRSPEQRAQLLARLLDFEKGLITLRIPGSQADQLYVLRQHMQFVRDNLAHSDQKDSRTIP